jgi:hypothetical protein
MSARRNVGDPGTQTNRRKTAMDKQGKKTKETAFDEIMDKMSKMSKGKVIGIVVVLVLIVLNVFWNLLSNKITDESQALRAEIAQVAARAAEAEKETLDVQAVKADVELIRKATDDFDGKLNAVIKAEETRLEILTKNAEDQKAYLESLRNLLKGDGQ